MGASKREALLTHTHWLVRQVFACAAKQNRNELDATNKQIVIVNLEQQNTLTGNLCVVQKTGKRQQTVTIERVSKAMWVAAESDGPRVVRQKTRHRD